MSVSPMHNIDGILNDIKEYNLFENEIARKNLAAQDRRYFQIMLLLYSNMMQRAMLVALLLIHRVFFIYYYDR